MPINLMHHVQKGALFQKYSDWYHKVAFCFFCKRANLIYLNFLKKTYKLDFGRKMELSGEIRTWLFINIFLKSIILLDNPI